MFKARKDHTRQHLLVRRLFGINKFVQLTAEIKEALFERAPIVALESTIISHGMPYPRNLDVAKEVQQTIRLNGAVPATIAIIDGVPKVGLNDDDLIKVAKNRSSVSKASTRDIGFVCANSLSAATTVASTMKLAHSVGIHIFATGGIGGVHRGAESSMDISADLIELSRTPVTVVCAGIKSILDIRRSLEVLETHGVPVVGFNAPQFPGFFTNDSGIASPMVTSDTSVVARMMANNKLLAIRSGIVVGVPNPCPANEEKIRYAIDFALISAAQEGITGAAITPYLLKKIEHLTGGESLDSNISLMLNNAKIATMIAKDWSIIQGKQNSARVDNHSMNQLEVIKANLAVPPRYHSIPSVEDTLSIDDTPISETTATCKKKLSLEHSVVVIGGAVVDIVSRISSSHSQNATSNPGTVQMTFGGVGRNIAESVVRLGTCVALASVVADDANGKEIVMRAKHYGIDVSNIAILPSTVNSANRTAAYNAIHDATGELVVGVSDMNIFSHITPKFIESLITVIVRSDIIVSDANLPVISFQYLANICHRQGVTLFFEPTSDFKCLLPFEAGCIEYIDIMKPNVSELVVMASHCLNRNMMRSGKTAVGSILASIAANRIDRSYSVGLDLAITDVRILAHAVHAIMSRATEKVTAKSKWVYGKHIIVSLGSRGVLWCGPKRSVLDGKSDYNLANSGIAVDDHSGTASVHIPAQEISEQSMTHTNGAGDALCGGFIAELIHKHRQRINGSPQYLPNIECIKAGLLNSYEWIVNKK